MQKAAHITSHAFHHLNVHHYRHESEVEAALQALMVERGAPGFAYIPVVAGNGRGVTLHYTNNDMPLHSSSNDTNNAVLNKDTKERSSILIDAGAVSFFFIQTFL